jgi:hypothetical protein
LALHGSAAHRLAHGALDLYGLFVTGVAGALEDGDDGAERDGGCTPKSAV